MNFLLHTSYFNSNSATMKKRYHHILLVILLMVPVIKSFGDTPPQPYLQWSQLPAVPDQVGFAGSIAGVSNGALLVAGGSNFPNGGTPWNGGAKAWYDKVYVLEQPNAQWKEAGRLPRPLGYAVSLTWRDG